MPHIDYLSARQYHEGGCPVFADRRIECFDFATGAIEWGTYAHVQHEGSHDSSLRIRSDGFTVEVSGNPSRFNREENVFGVRSVEAGIAVYNSVLLGLGLPTFSDEPRSAHERLLQSSDRSLARNGCHLTRVDVTENYSTGGLRNSQNALHALRAMRHRNRAPTDYGSTLSWPSKRYTSMKYYLKAEEMVANRKRKARKAEPSPYWDRVLQFVQAEGVLRFEVTCKAKFLRRNGLHYIGAWSNDIVSTIVKGFALHERSQASTASYHDIASALIGQGIGDRRAFRCQHAALAYLNGANLREGISKATFYRLRKDLLLVGIDINAPTNISALKFSVEKIELRPLEAPSWYRAA